MAKSEGICVSKTKGATVVRFINYTKEFSRTYHPGIHSSYRIERYLTAYTYRCTFEIYTREIIITCLKPQ